MKLTVGRSGAASAQACGGGGTTTKGGRPREKCEAGRAQAWNMESKMITKLDGARRAWETYARVYVGSFPTTHRVAIPTLG